MNETSERKVTDEDFAAAVVALSMAFGKRNGEEPKLPSTGEKIRSFLSKYIAPVLPSVITFALGFYFVQSAELDLKRQVLRADTADKIRSYVQYLIDEPEQTDGSGGLDKTRSTALVLGGFGRFAVHPLVKVLETSGLKQKTAAKEGLIHAGLIDPDYTCPILSNIVADETKAYRWLTVQEAAEILGWIGCANAVPALASLQTRAGAGKLDSFNKSVKDNIGDVALLKTIRDEAALAIRRINQRGGGR